jgi:hypothetical protein
VAIICKRNSAKNMAVRVQLAVYDLSRGMAMMMSQQILGQRIDGIWHTGIVVNNVEYYFGGGIQRSPYGLFARQSQLPAVRLDEMGETRKTQREIDDYIRSIRSSFSAVTYDLINNNCNHFANAFCIFLTGRGIPTEIVDLPRIVFSTPGGQMIRPMIESMQQGIQQQRGTMDPFGGYSQSPAPVSSGVAFEANLAANVQSTIAASASAVAPPPAPVPTKATLDDKPLISNDKSNVSTLGTKLINLPGADGVKGSLLTIAEKETINNVVSLLTAANADLKVSQYSSESIELLSRLHSTQPSAQLSCLFLLRLVVLSEQAVGIPASEALVDSIIGRLLSSDNGYSSPSAKVMAICALANLFGSEVGVSLIVDKLSALGKVIDIALSGLSSEKTEMRQMCSALASNVSVHLAIKYQPSNDDLQGAMIQLLLASVENLDGDADGLVRKRKLTIICRVVRALGEFALSLIVDLDILTTLDSLQRKTVNRLDSYETSIVAELKYSLSTM